MREELRELLLILLEPRTLQRGYFDADGIRKLMNAHLYEGREVSGRIWRLLMFEMWHRSFLEKFTKPAGLPSLPLTVGSGRTARSPLKTAPVPVGE